MLKLDRLAILVAVVSVAIVLASFVFASSEMVLMVLLTDRMEITFLSIWTLAAIPLAYAMPRLRVGFFGRMWQVPSGTYLLPRWIVRLGIGATIGQVAGILLLAILGDYRLFWLAGSLALVNGAFCAGALQRLKKHPRTEFTMRWWPRI